MKEYIVNLTNNLIGSNHFDIRVASAGTGWDTVQAIRDQLRFGEMKAWTPQKFGEVFCAISGEDVNIQNAFSAVPYTGDHKRDLCELVALCLARIIVGRLIGTVKPTYSPKPMTMRQICQKYRDPKMVIE